LFRRIVWRNADKKTPRWFWPARRFEIASKPKTSIGARGGDLCCFHAGLHVLGLFERRELRVEAASLEELFARATAAGGGPSA